MVTPLGVRGSDVVGAALVVGAAVVGGALVRAAVVGGALVVRVDVVGGLDDDGAVVVGAVVWATLVDRWGVVAAGVDELPGEFDGPDPPCSRK